MSKLPIGVGDAGEQKRFINEHEAFLREYPKLHRLLEKAFLRTLVAPPEQEVERLKGLPESDPAVVAFEDKVMADRVIFYLGRIAVDDFGELLILSGNGRGIGAYKILRGFYERIVTAAFIAKNPSEARAFVEDDSIQKWKVWQRAIEVMPEIKSRFSDEQINKLEQEYTAGKAKHKASRCNKCGQPKTQEAWTRVDLATMAKNTDANLAALYGACYVETTLHTHATVFGLQRRLRQTEEGHTFRESSEKEARLAVLLGHNLILRLLGLQNEYFGLGMESEIQTRIDMFPKIWDESE